MRWRSWRDSSGMARSLTMGLSSTWPGVACSPWQPIRRFGAPFKEGGNGGLTGDDGNARDYSVEKPAQTRHNGTLGRLKVQATAAAAEADKDDEPAAWSVQPKHAPDKHG